MTQITIGGRTHQVETRGYGWAPPAQPERHTCPVCRGDGRVPNRGRCLCCNGTGRATQAEMDNAGALYRWQHEGPTPLDVLDRTAPADDGQDAEVDQEWYKPLMRDYFSRLRETDPSIYRPDPECWAECWEPVGGAWGSHPDRLD